MIDIVASARGDLLDPTTLWTRSEACRHRYEGSQSDEDLPEAFRSAMQCCERTIDASPVNTMTCGYEWLNGRNWAVAVEGYRWCVRALHTLTSRQGSRR